MTGGTVKSYNYNDATYKDRLASYNGLSITYDTLGNPLSYLGKTLTWTGKELSTYTNSGTLTTYKYDANGIRLSKTTGSTVTNYLYDGSRLIREFNGTDTIWYLYDQNGMIGFQLNGTTYYYVYNLQGDVTKIINTSGTVYATYTYDAWGKCTVGTNTSSIADKNPIRYRGYYNDVETGLYLVGHRYYDPEVGRWINPDLKANNPYAFCGNDPINYYSSPSDTRIVSIQRNGNLSAMQSSAFALHAVAAIATYSSDSLLAYIPLIAAMSKPVRGKPNSAVGFPDGTVRVYGPDGKAERDLDYGHAQHHPGLESPHEHEWDWGKDGEKQNPDRGKAKNPTGPIPVPEGSGNGDNTANIVAGVGVGIAIVGLIWVVGNDITGVGVADDAAIPVLIGVIVVGLGISDWLWW